jgi:raffinose/stachyose/melibiose transport system substrate-binding protein
MKLFALVVLGSICIGCSHSEAKDPNAIQLRMLTHLIPPARDTMNDLLRQFHSENPGIQVTQETFPGNGPLLMEKLRTEILTGAAPDMFWLASGEIARPFIEAGYVADADPYYAQYDWKKILVPWAVEGLKYKGKLWGVPRATRAVTFWYRTDLFRHAGIQPPGSYAELEADCERLKADGKFCLSIGGKYGWNTMRLLDYLIEVAAGPELHEKLDHLQADWNCPQVVKAYSLLRRWIDKGWIVKGFLTLPPDDARLPWYQGEAAMVLEGDWMETVIRNDEQDIANFDFFIAPTDHIPLRVSGFPEQIMIASSCTHKEAAAAFLNWYIQPRVQNKYFMDLEGPTATLGVRPDPKLWPRTFKWRPILDRVSIYLPTDQELPNELMDDWYQIQDNLIAGRATPEQAAQQIGAATDRWKAEHAR